MHFFCSSGGNAGLGCVTAATKLGYPSTIAVPITTKPHVIAQLKSAGASSVIQIGESWYFADKYLREVVLPEAQRKGIEGVYVPPFEHEMVYEGNSKIITETREQLLSEFGFPADSPPDAVICSVGGGGLFTGVQYGLSSTPGWSSVALIATETEGASSLSTSLKAGELTTLPGITSIATSLGAVRVGQRTWEMAQKPNVKDVVLSDADAAMGVCRFADDERMLVEPACGVSLAMCYKPDLFKRVVEEKTGSFGKDSKVIIIVCGGSGMTAQIVEKYREEYKADWEQNGYAVSKSDVPSSFTKPI
ncbi:putative serine family amino acid catabolismprotein [Phaeomoniella chlamydospora]|uniref:L-serine ammonia-lyase n=1 Tax=Phaeomoniella chlamydospora TaxID=158046 RepID=A0A0G2F464_PHACM|nr:putative serine family amino acid catabolismprotein [Phaeomoniella chlamydospora]